MTSLADSIGQIPPITRFFTVCTVLISLILSLKITEADDLLFSIHKFTEELTYLKWCLEFDHVPLVEKIGMVLLVFAQTYRCFVTFLVPAGYIGGSPLGAVLEIYYFYSFANNVERGKFKRVFPDCLWFTLVCGTILLCLSLVYELIDPAYSPFHHLMMSVCILYTWCRTTKNSIINFFGIVPVKAHYLPLFMVGFRAIEGGYYAMVQAVIGIIGAYLYQCIESQTLPIYNLFPQFYPKFYRAYQSNKVGFMRFQRPETEDNFIRDAVFDKGYLPAPEWLYKLVRYPVIARRARQTAQRKVPIREPVSQPSASTSGFKGKGHRLGN